MESAAARAEGAVHAARAGQADGRSRRCRASSCARCGCARRALPDGRRDAGRRRARAAQRVPLGRADGAEAVAGTARRGATTRRPSASGASTPSGIVKDEMGTDLSVGTSFELDDLDKGSAPTELRDASRIGRGAGRRASRCGAPAAGRFDGARGGLARSTPAPIRLLAGRHLHARRGRRPRLREELGGAEGCRPSSSSDSARTQRTRRRTGRSRRRLPQTAPTATRAGDAAARRARTAGGPRSATSAGGDGAARARAGGGRRSVARGPRRRRPAGIADNRPRPRPRPKPGQAAGRWPRRARTTTSPTRRRCCAMRCPTPKPRSSARTRRDGAACREGGAKLPTLRRAKTPAPRPSRPPAGQPRAGQGRRPRSCTSPARPQVRSCAPRRGCSAGRRSTCTSRPATRTRSSCSRRATRRQRGAWRSATRRMRKVAVTLSKKRPVEEAEVVLQAAPMMRRGPFGAALAMRHVAGRRRAAAHAPPPAAPSLPSPSAGA